jgi:ubiquinone/menaquinone biosynthesis C-methylase UbiE
MDIIEPNEIVEGSFDCVIDKGTFDCIACAEDGPQKKIEQMLDNVYRILSPGGCYICVSRGPPETRLVYLHQGTRIKWKVETLKLQKKLVSGPLSKPPGIDVINSQG